MLARIVRHCPSDIFSKNARDWPSFPKHPPLLPSDMHQVWQVRLSPSPGPQHDLDPGHISKEAKELWDGNDVDPISITSTRKPSTVGPSDGHWAVDRLLEPPLQQMRRDDKSKRARTLRVTT